MKTIAENEKKREAADERTRAEYLELKKVVEAKIPEVEKKVEDLNTALISLSDKVEHLEDTVMQQARGGASRKIKDEQFSINRSTSTQFLQGKRDPQFNSLDGSPDSASPEFGDGSGWSELSGAVPPMTFPQFTGENLKCGRQTVNNILMSMEFIPAIGLK